MKRTYLLGNRGLLIIYAAQWFLTLALHAWFVYLVDSYAPHTAPWALTWLEGVFENLQSEVWQVGMFIFFSTYFIYKNSPQSRDGDDEMRADIQALRQNVARLEAKLDEVLLER